MVCSGDTQHGNECHRCPDLRDADPERSEPGKTPDHVPGEGIEVGMACKEGKIDRPAKREDGRELEEGSQPVQQHSL